LKRWLNGTTRHGITQEKVTLLAENEALLANPHVSAFLKAIAEAEGDGYDFKYGAVKGKRPATWRVRWVLPPQNGLP
jgi:hypothetical protein